MSKVEKTVMNEFSKQDDLVCTKEDKGGAIVILHVQNCTEKANKKLSNNNYYKKISHDPT